MARTAKPARRKERCRECALATPYYNSRALTGEIILCHCPHYKGGKFLHSTNDAACDKFVQRQHTTTLDD